MSTETLKKNRLPELDALRGLAALSVVLFHYTFGYDNGLAHILPNKFYFTYGNLGVQLFFIISGFVIFMTLEKTANSMDFIVSRFSRLYPTYWCAIILTVLITAVLSVPFQQGIYTPKQVLINLSMIQFWFKVKDVDGVYWTLIIELTFYILMWILFVAKQLKHIEIICFVWLILSFLDASFNLPFKHYLDVVFILKSAPLFISGIIFYLVKQSEGNWRRNGLIILSMFTEIYILVVDKKPLLPCIIVFFIYVTFYLFVKDKLKFLNNKIFLFFGAISYSLYLIHENIGFAIIYLLKRIVDNQVFYLPITITLMIGLASLINETVEKPAMQLIRNYYKKDK